MPSLPTSVEELNPLIPSDEQLQKKLKEDFEASMAEMTNNRKVSDDTRILLDGIDCMFAEMMNILRVCCTMGREEAKRNVVDEIEGFINKIKAMEDLCQTNSEVHLNKAINQAISYVYNLDIFGYLVGIYFPGDCNLQSIIGVFWMTSTMLRKDLLTQESLINIPMKSILLQNFLTKIFWMDFL